MRYEVTNRGSRARAFKVRGGFAVVEPGKTETIESALPITAVAGLDVSEVDETPALPGLTGKNKADLLAIAEAEGVEVADDATNAQIVKAIEDKRAEA
jgi:hypothetical protein